ncbi:hypothetical protein CAL14_05355 [Bordetella genomosp. 9]|uniref:hypothetical protein n=1 Tax=Bordetella genomosp. 9 TaxID=1416803 RepID=UPI000A294676|nr:hypothetical protein [Bordetella genomosp. 9]ARP89782.1 hypothetical protein CAL14_05355 [Bordetella genomosp. 9]
MDTNNTVLTDDQWVDLAERHANSDWNSDQPDGYLNAVKALCQDFLSILPAASEAGTPYAAAPSAQPAVNGYTCTVPDDCETLHWRGQILSMNELASVAQPAASAEPVAWIRKNGFRFNADIEPQDDNEIPLYAAPVAAQAQPDYPGATVADRLDAMADDCAPGSQRAADLRAAATVWRKHLAGPAAQPKRSPYNASGSLSEYGIFPECDAAPAAQAQAANADARAAIQAAVDKLSAITPRAPVAITYDRGWEIIDVVQKELCAALAAAKPEQDDEIPSFDRGSGNKARRRAAALAAAKQEGEQK